jgi:hypothetical protein
MGSRKWTQEELDYLEDKWGVISIKAIAKNLNRSFSAIKLKANRIGLDDARNHIDGLTLLQLAKAINTEYNTIKYWIKNKGFPVRHKVTSKTQKFKYLTYKDFWKWCEEHKDLINLARFEKGAIGEEPDWADEKRKADALNIQMKYKTSWTKEEELKLISLVKLQKYTYPELVKILNRSEHAIKRKLHDLNIPDRPVSIDTRRKWTDKELSLLVKLREKGYGENTIAELIGRSGIAVRGKLERMTKVEGVAI